jgi:SAM-dependent methyltransferase
MPRVDSRVGRTLGRWRQRIIPTPVQKREGEPVSRVFGTDRGTSIDRYWIEGFLQRHASSQQGKAAEVAGTRYLRRYFSNYSAYRLQLNDDGAPDTVVCNLEVDDPSLHETFDLFVATQVFNFVFETRVALRNAALMLKPGGMLLGSVAAITQVSRYDAERWGHFYSFTRQSWERLLREAFRDVRIESYGNVDSACAFLNGYCAEDLSTEILDHHDDEYPVVLCFRASDPVWVR